MQKYLESLRKVISMKPSCVIPSHGIALGGTFILEKTLKHRMLREKQIFELHTKGLSIDEILNLIYFNIPKQVIKYARKNIESHLDKLKIEGRI